MKWATSYGVITITPSPRSAGWTLKNDGVPMYRTPELHRALDYAVVVYGATLTHSQVEEGRQNR